MASVGGSVIYELLTEELPFGVMLLDPARKAVAWNHRAESITGYMRREVIGRFCCELPILGCERREQCETQPATCAFRPLALHRHTPTMNVLLQHRNGHSVGAIVEVLLLAEGEAGVAVLFQERSSAEDSRKWMLQSRWYTEDQFGLPTAAAMRQELQLTRGQAHTAVLLLEVEQAEQMARHFGRELVNALVRQVVRSVSQVLDAPHLLGHWSSGTLLLVVPHCDSARADNIVGELQRAAETFGVRWWGDLVRARLQISHGNADDNAIIDGFLRLQQECNPARVEE